MFVSFVFYSARSTSNHWSVVRKYNNKLFLSRSQKPQAKEKGKDSAFCRCVTLSMCNYPFSLQIPSCFIHTYTFFFLSRNQAICQAETIHLRTAKILWSSIITCIFKLIINSVLSLGESYVLNSVSSCIFYT